MTPPCLLPDTRRMGCPVFLWRGSDALSTNEREKRVRVNRMIRISPVRVIGPGGEQLGVLAVEEALAAAQERGLDLVEVAPTARPPVVKIMDYGKYKFEEAKAARAAKKKQHVIHLKEIKLRPGIDDHDFDFKTRHAREFLLEGDKVKVTMMYRGRQITHLELGRAVLDKLATTLADVGKIEQDAKLEGRNMVMVLAPGKGSGSAPARPGA
jgi:translation initiation factor IF-3